MTSKRHPIRAVIVLAIYLILSVVLVWIAVSMAPPDLSFVFNDTLRYALIIGIPMSAFGGLTSYFSKGELHRLILGLLTTILIMLYIYFILNTLDLGWRGDELVYSITPSGLLLLSLLAAALKGVYHVLEYFVYREDKSEPQAVAHPEPQEEPQTQPTVY